MVTKNICSSIFLLDWFKERKETKQIKTQFFFHLNFTVYIISQISAEETYSKMDLHDHFDFNEAEFTHENFLKVILYFEYYGNANCK